MCLSKVATYPDCGHIRLTVVLCDLIHHLPSPDEYPEFDNLEERSSKFSEVHTGPPLTIHIEDPEGSVCLCQQGIEMTPKPETEFEFGTALAVYRYVIDCLGKYMGFSNHIVKQTMEWLENRHLGSKTIDLPVIDTKMPVPDLDLNGREVLLVYTPITYDHHCPHGIDIWAMERAPRDISSIPSSCPECHGRIKHIPGATSRSIHATGLEMGHLWEISFY